MSSGVLSTKQNEGRKMVNLRAGSAAYRLLRKPKNCMTRENLQKSGDFNHLSQRFNNGKPTNLKLVGDIEPVKTYDPLLRSGKGVMEHRSKMQSLLNTNDDL